MRRMFVEEELYMKVGEEGSTYILENVNDYDYLLITVADYEGFGDMGSATIKITKNNFDNLEYLTLYPLDYNNIDASNLSIINDNLILEVNNGLYIQIIGGKY